MGKEIKDNYYSKDELNNAISSFKENGVIGRRSTANLVNEEACVAGPAVAAVAILFAAVVVWVFVAEFIAFWVDVCVQTDDAFVSPEEVDARTGGGKLFREQLINSIAKEFVQ